MKATLALAGLVPGLLPSARFAAQAKKNHYKDPMDGGALVPVSPKKAPTKG